MRTLTESIAAIYKNAPIDGYLCDLGLRSEEQMMATPHLYQEGAAS